MLNLRKGRYVARFAESDDDLAAAQELRHLAFIAGAKGPPRAGLRDADAFDERCRHVLVEDCRDGRLMCCFRVLALPGGGDIAGSYSAQFYDLSALERFEGPMVEVGRFCIRPGQPDADILRMAWGALTRLVDAEGVAMLFGCSSFHGTDTAAYGDAFAMLRARHLAPQRWLPRVKAPQVFRFAARLRRAPDPRRAMQAMPPLLRSYLSLGGWVSDHAVLDFEMNTLHVFTGLEIGNVPPGRAERLRVVAG